MHTIVQRFSTFFFTVGLSIFLYSVDPLLLTVIQNFESCGPPDIFCGPLRRPWTNHCHSIYRINLMTSQVFSRWLDWSRYVTAQHAKGASILYRIDQNRLLTAVVRAWKSDARQSRKQSLWMQRLMRQTTSDPDFPIDEDLDEDKVDEIGKLVICVTVFDPRLEGHMLEGKHLVAKIFSFLDFKSLARWILESRLNLLSVTLR